jgi:hypothetical protein
MFIQMQGLILVMLQIGILSTIWWEEGLKFSA